LEHNIVSHAVWVSHVLAMALFCAAFFRIY